MIARHLRHPLLIVAVSLIVLPHLLLGLGFTWGLATEIAIMAMVGVGYNLLLGYTGLLSFGHGLFFGLAAYATVLSQLHWFKQSFLLPALFALSFSALLGWSVGLLVLRRRGVYFSLLTLAATALTFYIAYRWTSFTGGENGLSGVERYSVAGLDLGNQAVFYHFSAIIVLGCIALVHRVTRSPLGSVLLAIRENETRARFVGYPVHRYKLTAFVLSATVTGLGGVLMAYLKLFVSADWVHVNFSGEILAATIFGGTGSFLGPVVGAAFFILFREVLSSHTSAWQFWFGLVFMAFILFSPAGLMGLGAKLLAPLRRKREEDAAMAARVTPAPGQAPPDFLREHPATSTNILNCSSISKAFGEFRAVQSVNLSISDRSLFALIGPNGAGKTTLFNTVSGMYAPDHGTIRLGDIRLDALPAEQIVHHGLSRSFQITSLFQALTVWENLRLGVQARDARRMNAWRSANSLRQVNEETSQLVQYLGLAGIEQVPVSSLSYGGQRLVEIGVALAAKPRVLLLDEPLAGLAAAERERIGAMIRTLARYMAVLLVEHDIDRVFGMADRVMVMNEGSMLTQGAPQEVRAHPEVQRVYIGAGISHVAAARVTETSPATTLLELKGVNTFYGKSHILHDVSLVAHAHQVTALLGRNGAGKSSTFKSILALAIPASGSVTFDGEQIDGLPPEIIARRGIALVPQGRRLFAGLTVEENLRLGSLARSRGPGIRWNRSRIYEVFPRVREKLHTRADALSGGEQQMVAIARALSGNVKLLLMDEPFEGLSPVMVEEVFKAIERLREEVTILIIEHHLDLVLSLADRAVVLDRGHVAHDGPAAPLLNDLAYRKQVLWL